MDLLEITNNCADAIRHTKEHSITSGGHGEGCELATTVLVIRDDFPEVGLTVDDDEIKAGFRVGANIFAADAIVLAVDGKSLRPADKGRRQILTIAADRSGEILWKTQPYAVVGSLVIFPGAEVPDELPAFATGGMDVMAEIRGIMSETAMMPLHMSKYWPDEERARAELDITISKSIQQQAGLMNRAVDGIQLYSRVASPRQEVLSSAGIPVVFL